MDKVGIALLAIAGMLSWIGLWGWIALTDWSSSGRLLARGWTATTPLRQAASKPLYHFWHSEYIVRGLAAILVLIGIYFFNQGMNGTSVFAKTFASNFATECFGLAATVLVIEQLYRWRDKSRAVEHKRNIIQQIGSRSNDFALDASRIAKNEGWLNDGSLQGADLTDANLQGADLSWAHLEGTKLRKANLQGADLTEAYLQNAQLRDANLRGAKLVDVALEGAKLQKANLQNVKLSGSSCDSKTTWPRGFDPIAAGVVLVEA